MSPAVLLVRPPDKSVCQRLLLLLWPEVLLLLLLLVMEAVDWMRVETVLTTDALYKITITLCKYLYENCFVTWTRTCCCCRHGSCCCCCWWCCCLGGLSGRTGGGGLLKKNI